LTFFANFDLSQAMHVWAFPEKQSSFGQKNDEILTKKIAKRMSMFLVERLLLPPHGTQKICLLLGCTPLFCSSWLLASQEG